MKTCKNILLDFLLEEHNFSMPVGRIEYMYMGPMSFNEFLHAGGKKQLLNYLDNYSLGIELPVIIHHKLLALFRQYIYLGGMPEVIKTYLDSESYRNAEIVKQAIIKTYQDDFVKYKKRINYSLLVKVFLQLTRNIAKKIKYVNILRDERSKSIADSIHLFSQARIINIIKHTSANGSPLGAEVKNKLFKIIFLDVGLMLAMNGLTYNDIKNMEYKQLVNLGDVCEQFTGQHLLYSKEAFYEPELYYWQREHKNSAAEIDYLIAESATIIPIEVKSGKTGQLKSLHQFIKAKQSPLAVRLNMDLPTLLNTENSLPDGNTVSYKLLSLPIYMIEQLRRLIRTQL
jgi:predicted AAA+ superfamily ATPase